MSVVLQKRVKITSRGRYVTMNKGAVIGPQTSYYNESVTAIKYLLDKYPAIKIVEMLNDGRTVNLTVGNYNKDNNVKSVPVAVTENITPSKEPEEPEKPEAPAEDPMKEEASVEPDPQPDNAENPVEPKKEEAPVVDNSHQQSKKDKNRNKNRNNQQQAEKSTEVIPEEP